MNIELLDKDGKSLITSLSDSVKITFTEGGISQSVGLSVKKLPVSATDATSVQQYNGLVINENSMISRLSSREKDQIHDFKIYLNGVSIGDINKSSVPYSFTFNHEDVKEDTSFNYFVGGSGI